MQYESDYLSPPPERNKNPYYDWETCKCCNKFFLDEELLFENGALYCYPCIENLNEELGDTLYEDMFY